MDSLIQILIILASTLCSFIVFIYYYKSWNGKQNKNRAPRAAGALPIIGHLHHFGSNQLLHKTLGAMADKHGPTFTISLGSREILVISNWKMAKECFTTHDKVFADKPKITAGKILAYDFAMFGFAPYGSHWRQMRKIAKHELLSHRRTDMLQHTRASEVQTSLKELYNLWSSRENQTKGLLVDMKEWFENLTLNAALMTVVGKRFVVASEDKKLMKDFMHNIGRIVISDVIPLLGWLDIQGHEKNMRRIAKELDTLLGGWLEQHKLNKKVSGEAREDQDFMDVMINVLEGADFSAFDADTINKATCLNLIVAASDTLTVTITWALSLLLNNPLELKKVKEELDIYVSKDRHVDEADIKNLVYLQAVVKETLRLYPPGPVIGLRSAMEDCTISPGYHVPSGTQLMLNVSKIQRDESIWPEPNEFRPERFLTSHKDIDVRGHNFELIPFGSGRRSCPGISLALQMMHFTLASVLHCYDIVKPSDAEIDMTESPGLTNLKAKPLEVYVTPRVHIQ